MEAVKDCVKKVNQSPNEILDSACLPWIPEEAGQHYPPIVDPTLDDISSDEIELIEGDVRHFAELIDAKDFDWNAEENGEYIEVTLKVMIKRESLV